MKTESKLIKTISSSSFVIKIFWKRDHRSRKTHEIVVDHWKYKLDPVTLDLIYPAAQREYMLARGFTSKNIDRYSIVVKKREDALNLVTELLLIL